MKSSDSIVSSTQYKAFIILLALVGAILILLSTSRYGAGLSPDSVGYIAAARNLLAGAGFICYNGSPTVVWPPLYPACLALLSRTFGTDPFFVANVLNALIFGLIVYVGGVLAFKHAASFPSLALVATLAMLFSRPLFVVSVMAWTEPLFILFVLLCLIVSDSYLSKQDTTSLVLLSLSVALASLTRYIGVTLILWGAFIIVGFHRDRLKHRLAHLSLFTLISTLPVAIWLIRNYAISSSLFGPRGPSVFTLSQNLTYLFTTLLSWYIPRRIAERHSILMIVIAGLCLWVSLRLRSVWQGTKERLQPISPLLLFTSIYTAFLVISSTTTAYDPIDDRLLSPIYVPLTLIWLVLAQAFVDPYRKGFRTKSVKSFIVICIAIWFVYPMSYIIVNAINLISFGRGYSGKAWRDSETIRYLLQHRALEAKCALYTNGPDATYIVAHIAAKMSPAKSKYNSPEMVDDVPRLIGSWPEEDNACLIWFDTIDRPYLFTVEELQAIANMDRIARLKDGAIYSITRK